MTFDAGSFDAGSFLDVDLDGARFDKLAITGGATLDGMLNVVVPEGFVKAGYSHGATDEFGRHAVEGRVLTMDLHATLLAVMGLDHERLTYNHAGRNFRLTDVGGRVAWKIFKKGLSETENINNPRVFSTRSVRLGCRGRRFKFLSARLS